MKLRISVALAAFLVTALVAVPAHAGASVADEALLAQSVDVAFASPNISVVLPDLDGGTGTCQYDLSGRARIYRPAGSGSITESGSVTALTSCARNVTGYLRITDSAPTQPSYERSCQSTAWRASSCSAAQQVAYFTGAVLTRPSSTIVFRYELRTGTVQRICFIYRVTMVGGTVAAEGIGPCDEATLAG